MWLNAPSGSRCTTYLPPLKQVPLDKLDGREVEFDVSGNSAKKVGPAIAKFVNPYNFLSAVPRDTIPVGNELGDRPPTTHDRLHAGHYTGTLRVTLTTVTPLLIPDAALAKDKNGDGHKSFPVRVVDGKPYLAPTAVKGMLRSAYEAITNSRLGVFPGSAPDGRRLAAGHGVRLAMRMPAGDGLSLVPARIEGDKITLLLGTTTGFPWWNGQRWEIPGNLLYAAWLERYLGTPLTYLEGGALRPQHGDAVHCWVQKIQHWRFDWKKTRRYVPDFQFWAVREITRDPSLLKRPTPVPGSPPVNPDPNDEHPNVPKSAYQPLAEAKKVEGWVNVSNRNIKGKHDERVFFNLRPTVVSQHLTPALVNAWAELIQDYQQVHIKDLEERKKNRQQPWNYLGDQPGKTAWSRHVYTKDAHRLDLGPTLCYARVNEQTGVVLGLYPVMISRKLFPASPLESLHDSLRPATDGTKLSPADRVFGWVNQEGKGAHRGQLRVGPVKVSNEPPEGALHKFDPEGTPNPQGLPLAILGQPKSAQARFYLGDNDGKAFGIRRFTQSWTSVTLP